MVKKIMTGLALSLGAGLALTAATRNNKKKGGWHPATSEGIMTPVTIRVHTALCRTSDNVAGPIPDSEGEDQALVLSSSPERAAELAEIRMMIETLDQRSSEMLSTVNQRIDDLQNHLPRFIDVKVTSRIREVEERLRTEFQDEQSRTLDAFLKTLDQKVLPRISMLEDAVGAQGAEIGQMRQRIEKTDDTLDRVLDRIEKAVDSLSNASFAGYPTNHLMEISQKAVA
jgi:hypothetical protein